MKNTILKMTALSLFAAAMVAAPVVVNAQVTTNAPGASESAPPAKKAKKAAALPFTGKVVTIDTNAMTLTIGKRTFDVTSETKITKDGQPATLADGVAGETVSGSYKKNADGKLSATTVSYTTKAAGTKKKKQLSAETTGTSTNSVTK